MARMYQPSSGKSALIRNRPAANPLRVKALFHPARRHRAARYEK